MTDAYVEPSREELHNRRGLVSVRTVYLVRQSDGTLYRHAGGVAQFDKFETASAVVEFLNATEDKVSPLPASGR